MRAGGGLSLLPSHAIFSIQVLRWDNVPFLVLELRGRSTKFWIDDIIRWVRRTEVVLE
jgi:hypothetical protein